MTQKIEGFRLSPQQEHLWSLLGNGTPQSCRARCTVQLDGDLDPAALQEAVGEAVARHEILRTRFLALPGMAMPLQVIGAEGELGTVLVPLSPPRHLLKLDLPALCADRAALAHLAREISAAYARRRGAGGPAADEPVQYVDAAEAFHELLESADTQKGREHWLRQDLSAVAEAALPWEREAGGDFAPAVVARSLDAGTAEAVDGLARRLGVSASGFFLACWQILLGRLTGRRSLVLGVACDGRTYDDLKGSVGLFARHVPFAVELRSRPRFVELWRRTEEALAEIGRRQDFFAWKLRPGQPEPGAPFFPFCFESEERVAPWTAGGVVFSLVECQSFFDRFRVKLGCVRSEAGVAVELAFDAGALPPEEAGRLLERYCTLVAGAAALPESEIDDLEIVPPAERRRLLADLNDTAVSFPDLCLHELFEAQAERTPGRVAVVWEGGELTFADLRSRARRLSRRLQRLGVGPETRVAVLAERSPDMLAGLLAVLGAGAAYVPLDPASPRERLEWMLADARPAALLLEDRFAAAVPAGGPPLVTFAEGFAPGAEDAPEAPAAGVTPGHAAYVIYTSGSTGRPKGVVMSHRGIVNRLLWMQRTLPLAADDVVIQKTPFSFDASIWEIFVPLLAGATLVLARPDGHLDPAYLAGLIAARRATVLQLVPSMLRVFLEEPGVERCTSLRRVFCGGEALAADLGERFFSRLSAELHNLYGPTECAIDATHWTCRREGGAAETAAGAVVPIGRPIDNDRVYVLDAGLRLVPEGVIGELFVGGAGLARGYLGRPDLTAERFLPDPCGDVPGARLYRTGDLVRHLPEGGLGFLGRTDHQVKIRGFRIELEEIEAALAAFPAVLEAAVATWDDGGAVGARLVAYVVARPGEEPEAASLQAFLAGRLPEHMVPALFVRLPALPRLSNSKLDRRALPAPDPERMGLGRAFVAPRTPTEEVLAGIWSDVLGREKVGVHDDFFDLGGHSLLATRVVTKIREALRCEVSLRSLFDTRTVAALGASVDEGLRRSAGPALERIQPAAQTEESLDDFLAALDQMAPDDVASLSESLRLER
jgi:amino acid adenylation domain-containing protein